MAAVCVEGDGLDGYRETGQSQQLWDEGRWSSVQDNRKKLFSVHQKDGSDWRINTENTSLSGEQTAILRTSSMVCGSETMHGQDGGNNNNNN